jgi:transposase-like protein
VAPTAVLTDRAAADPPAIAVVLPGILHETGKMPQQRIERDHQHRKGRVRGLRGGTTLAGGRVLCRAHACSRNIRNGSDDLGVTLAALPLRSVPPVVSARDALTADLPTW